MRKGLGCGAVGDTREDLQVVSRSWDIRSLGGVHTATVLHFAD